MTSHAIYLLATLTCANAAAHGGHCPCKFQGAQLTAAIYNNYPNKVDDPLGCVGSNCKKYPGMYKTMAAINIYGTTCAAWDQIPHTPWYSSCQSGSNWASNDFNWCQQPWCYVDKDCAGDKVASSVFKGSDVAYYSYHSCGHTANCYTDIAWNANFKWPTGCPYSPHGGINYKVHKAGNCACSFQGSQLNANFYMNYPNEDPSGCQANAGVTCKKTPGMYKTKSAIKYYGTTCAAWDQMPGTPWYGSCPAGSDWCHYDYNWCQQPWCYVNSACTTRVATSVFKGSTIAFYSYDTCLGTPNCYTNVASEEFPSPPAACPFDYSDNKWYTAKTCTYWTGQAPTQSSYARTAQLAGGAMTLMLAMLAM